MILLTGLGLTALVVYGIYWLNRLYERYGLMRVTYTFIAIVFIVAMFLKAFCW